MNKECCGTCAWHFPKALHEWECTNEDSDYCGIETEYWDCCVDYEERE